MVTHKEEDVAVLSLSKMGCFVYRASTNIFSQNTYIHFLEQCRFNYVSFFCIRKFLILPVQKQYGVFRCTVLFFGLFIHR